MKLLTPITRGPSVWACTSSFGGGLVAGDETRLEIRLGDGTRCHVGTQASTKVYRNPAGRPCGHVTRARVGCDALLTFTPDPVQAFSQSRYVQNQDFHLGAGASLVLLDWLTSGRAACGERWEFDRYESRTTVFGAAGEPLWVDALRLDPSTGPLGTAHRLGRFNCLAVVLFTGPATRVAAARLLSDLAARPVGRREAIVASASPAPDGAMLRIAGESVEEVGQALRPYLQSLSELLGDDPWKRKW